ncbi:hypothetical protein E8E15_007465 [Penicillium rubens]|mgnify:FL=1|jgi:hypothetical protein|uniref:Uncharacterized protein n=2 Tax=Penicillium chrysogenum species complex TaxID=254878 RepID=B6GZA9_PENRW|nr:uncharacterized protein N7525_001304 [Penicillium rubens]KZN85449.1 hypothetical protein EN45_096290 [Penicillium chrysogenum]CAP80920.1 hypothetical protein PCH_Pc12g12930 [Penicillium rubens Wisconsin 54-1255]KAF3017371.1 hypothetical protein E8E15_007465 [Penicillium rubens]KAJ5034700.1 hypothetical protein NUH16_006143 [Penicillium rubens]KAJ5843563.1 hypothetical protein N7525_001304 [Penicillium rubens]
MRDNILVAVLLSVTFVTPVFAWLFYLWYRSHVTQMHQEGQVFNRRNRDRAQANYEPTNGAQNPIFGPYFTPRGWVRPKTRGSSHVLRPPQYVHTRQPVFTGNPNSDQPFQGPNQASSRSPQRPNQQPNPLSKRQQRKQRALQNKQKQQQQNQNEQPSKQNRQNRRKQKFKNQGQNSQKSPNAHSPNPQGAQNEQHHRWGITEGQNYQTSNHGGDGWGNDEGPQDNQHSARQSENNDRWGSNVNYDQGGLRNGGSSSPRRGSLDIHNSPREKSSHWGDQHDDHRHSDGRRDSNEQQQHRHHGWPNSRPASPDQASRSEAAFGGGWGQSDHGRQGTSYPRSNHSIEDHNRYRGRDDDRTKSYKKHKGDRHTSPERNSRTEADTGGGWGQSGSGTRQNSPSRSNHPNEYHSRYSGLGDDDTKSYKKRKGSRYGSPERKSRGRPSPSRDRGNKSRNRSRSNSWEREEAHRSGGSPTWGQDSNVHRDKKKKKERWEIELEENAKRCRSRSPSRERSVTGWDKHSQRSHWKETQKW